MNRSQSILKPHEKDLIIEQVQLADYVTGY
jgi:hypothetical protein